MPAGFPRQCRRSERARRAGTRGARQEHSQAGGAPAARHAARHDTADRFDNVASKLSKVRVPQVDIRVVGGIGLVVLLTAIGYWLFSRQSLEKQTEEVARAFVKADMKAAIDVSRSETALDTIQWYAMRFKQYNELKLAFGGQEAGATIVEKGEKDGVAEVTLLFSKGGVRFDGSIFNEMFQPNPSLANTKQTLEIPLFWVKDFWGNWKLDGTRTYAGTATR